MVRDGSPPALLPRPVMLTTENLPLRVGPFVGAPADRGAEPQGDAPRRLLAGSHQARATSLRRPPNNRLVSATARIAR
jgi:hypothetical protein